MEPQEEVEEEKEEEEENKKKKKKKWTHEEKVSPVFSSARMFRIQNRDLKSYGRW